MSTSVHSRKKIISNFSWLFFDNILRLGLGLLVSIYIARYLGPEKFGLWNYVISFAFLFGAIAPFGLKGILLRELINYPRRRNELLGSAFILRLIGGVISFAGSLVAIYFMRPGETFILLLVGIYTSGFIFQSFDVINSYFQSKVQSKYIIIATNAAFFIGAALKVFFVLIKANLIAFALTVLVETILTSAFFIVSFKYNHFSVKSWRFDLETAKYLFRQGWPIVFGAVSFIICTKADQVIIGQMLGDKAVGYYAVAVKLSESFLFLAFISTQSIMPSITKAKQKNEKLYRKKVQDLYNMTLKAAFIFSILIAFFSRDIIGFLYTDKYLSAVPVLLIYIWSTIFLFLRVTSRCYCFNEYLSHISSIGLAVGAVVNIVLNLVLIRIYGIAGAAIATVISYIISGYIVNLFHVKLFPNFWMQTRALLSMPNPLSYRSMFKM